MQTHINIFSEDANGVHINKINEDYLARYSEKVIKEHRDAMPTDHADGSIGTAALADGAVTLEKIADGAVDEAVTKMSENLVTSGAVWEEFWKTPRLYSYGTNVDFNEIYAEGIHTISVPGSANTPTDDSYWVLFCFSETQIALNQETGVMYSRITLTDNIEQTTYWGDWSEISLVGHTHEDVKEALITLETAISKEAEARQNLDKNLTMAIEDKADDIHEHTMADITDLGDKITGLETDINAETSARQTADDALDERITAMEQSGGSGDSAFSNCFNPLETYDSENVITDINGNIYVGQSMELGSAYANYTVDVTEFARAISKGNVMLKLGFAHLHMGIDECDMGGFAPYESGLTITYADGTTETATFAGSNNISVECTNSSKDISFTSGYSGNYNYALYTFKFENTKDIEGIKFSLLFDNYYTETPADGGACIQNVYVDTLVCYDEKCVVTREQLEDALGEQSCNIVIDSNLSDVSENPVQNKVVNEALNKKLDWENPYPGFDSMDEVCQAVIDLQNNDAGHESNLYTHTTTPAQIGTWLDGTPIWRVSFDVDYTFSADVKDEDGYYYPLNNVMNVDNTNYAAILDCKVFARCGSPCMIDDVVGFRNGQEYIYFSSLSESMHDGVYGYVDFITPADNFVETASE